MNICFIYKLLQKPKAKAMHNSLFFSKNKSINKYIHQFIYIIGL